MKVKYAILGAGISGLAFAGNLNSDDYVILEKESDAGGLCGTHKACGEYVWDFAGHFFHFKNDESRRYFEPVLEGSKCVRQVKNTKINFQNEMIDYPFQKNIHQLKKDDFIDCLYDLFFKEEKETYISFKDMLFGKFGKGICDRFLVPYNEKLYACDLDELDQNAMGRFFPYADLTEIIQNMKKGNNVSYNDHFLYPIDGAYTVIDYLLHQVKREKIHLNEEVLSIDPVSRRIVSAEDTYEYQYLVSTIPFPQLLGLTGERVPECLSWNKVLVFNIGFDRPSIDRSLHWIYYPDKDVNFYRVGFYNNILRQEKLSIYVEIGFGRNQEVDIQGQYAQTLSNLRKCGVIDEHKVVEYESLLIDPAYVHISTESMAYIGEKRKQLEKIGIYTTGRYGEWTYCSMEDCFLRARELSGRIDDGETK